MGAESFHADGQIDMAKLTVAPRNFANAPRKYILLYSLTNGHSLFYYKNCRFL